MPNIICTLSLQKLTYLFRGRRGRDHMVVGFTTTYAIDLQLPMQSVPITNDVGNEYSIMG
jgi:hypothetical protein